MIDIRREVARVRYPVLALSALAWTALVAAPSAFRIHVHGPAMGRVASKPASLSMLLAMNPPSAIAAGWALMLVAMMSPLLIPAVHHIRFTSLARRRLRSIACFVVGYGAVWMASGALITVVELAVRTRSPQSCLPAAAVALIAAVWQASPFKQQCLNRCHDNRPLAVFDPEADRDALRFGLEHGRACAGACGVLMLLPMLLPEGHLLAMAAVAVLIFCERLEDPQPPRWKMRGLGKASRILTARIRIHFLPLQ